MLACFQKLSLRKSVTKTDDTMKIGNDAAVVRLPRGIPISYFQCGYRPPPVSQTAGRKGASRQPLWRQQKQSRIQTSNSKATYTWW